MSPLVRTIRRFALYGTAVGALATLLATTSFAHGGAATEIVVQPARPVVGDWVEVTGTGFSPGMDVLVELSGADTMVLGTSETGADGSFARSLRLPIEAAAGEWQVRARSEDGAEAVAAVTLVPAGAPAGSPATAVPAMADERLPVIVALGAVAAIAVLGLAFVLGLFHGAAARLHRHRVGRRMDESDDPLFTRRRRSFARRGSVELPPVKRDPAA